MFLFDRAKARTVALLMAATASLQLWPNAYADVAKATVAKEAETKAPKKGNNKKKQDGHASDALRRSSPWRFAAPAGFGLGSTLAAKKKPDPVKDVIRRAKQQLGKPYRWAAEGPNAFDCSGFTKFVWLKAGVHLPHNSGAQRAATKPVPLDAMKPGDLIFSPGHVGMYVGGGKMIHSPRSGRTVSIDPIHSRAYGAGRVLSAGR